MDEDTGVPPPLQSSLNHRISSTSSPRTFSCSICGRTYKARETLNRHRNVHTAYSNYVCSVCGIGFYRKDLLARHSKLHGSQDATRGNTKGRQRSQRACDRCRARKMRCNSKLPCSTCFKSEQDCSYSRMPDRLSQRDRRPISAGSVAPETNGLSRASSASVSEEDVTSAHTAQHDLTGVTAAEDINSGTDLSIVDRPESNINLESSGSINKRTLDELDATEPGDPSFTGFDQYEIELGVDNEMVNPRTTAFVESSWPSETWTQSQSWPWLYEDMFLQSTPYLDMDLFNAYDGTFDSEVSNPALLSQMFPINASHLGQENLTSVRGSPLQTWQAATATDQRLVQRTDLEGNHGSYGQHIDGDAGFQANSQLLMNNLNDSPENLPPAQSTLRQLPRASKTGTKSPGFLHREGLVNELVAFAFQKLSEGALSDQTPPSRFWQDLSPQVEHAFNLTELAVANALTSVPVHILHCFVQLYFDHFHPLWTLIWQQDLNFDDIPPHLYLTLSSIGAMYAGRGASMYGSMMHESLRMAFTTTPMWYAHPEEASESLCQSMLLVQVSALYFGQKKAFSCGQHLGSILITIARKMKLFEDDFSCLAIRDRQIFSGPENRIFLDRLARAEARRRLAFGIFRADIFLSVLLNTRPLISYEEMNMEMPCAASLWRHSAQDLQQYLLVVERNHKTKRRLLFSDLVRIAMDRSEPLPMLNPAESELLLFALQQSVWRFSHDSTLFPRLTGADFIDSSAAPAELQNDFFDNQPGHANTLDEFRASLTRDLLCCPPPDDSPPDHLDCSIRPMSDLKTDFSRTLYALRKWKASFSATSTSAQLTADRSVLISSRLLCHLSFIRLKADVETFHLISYAPTVSMVQEQESIQSVHTWSKTRNAQDALAHACAIWSLVTKETARTETSRAKFNILAFISLHHAASVVWAYAGTHTSPGKAALDMGDRVSVSVGEAVAEDLRIFRDNNSVLLTSFARLLGKVSPAWIAMSGFSATMSGMAGKAFPGVK